jgi:glycosyltransferase involved in cell wall biosynthesis
MTASSNPPNAGPAPRVLHLDDGRGFRGGQNQVLLLMQCLAAKGIPQRLLAHIDGPLGSMTFKLGFDVDHLRYRGEWDFIAPRHIVRIAREFNANIIHAHTGHTHAIGLRASRRLGGAVRMIATRRVDFPISTGWLGGRKYRDPRRHFIAISNGVRQVLIDGGVPPAHIDVVFSGVSQPRPDQYIPRADVRRALRIAPDEIAIVNTGALTDHKGHRWLIEAAPRIVQTVPAARIHILGEGELRPTLETQIRAAGLENQVRLHGHVNDARLKLLGFDLYVSSSHLEGLGTAILDAMLAGLPVVAAAAGGVPDAVVDGPTGHRTGRLVPPRDARALADAIIAALTETETTRTLIANARRHVADRFSADAMAAGTLAVYRKLLAGNP